MTPCPCGSSHEISEALGNLAARLRGLYYRLVVLATKYHIPL